MIDIVPPDNPPPSDLLNIEICVVSEVGQIEGLNYIILRGGLPTSTGRTLVVGDIIVHVINLDSPDGLFL